MATTRPPTRGYTVARVSAFVVGINIAAISIWGVSIPTFERLYDAFSALAVVALIVQIILPGQRVVRLVALFGVWMTLVPRSLWWLADRPEKYTVGQSILASSSYLALAVTVAALVVMADLLDGIRE